MIGAAEDHRERDGSSEVLKKITRTEVDHERCCRISPGERAWITRGIAKITRGEVDHATCYRRSSGETWIMKDVTEDNPE